MNDPKDKSCSVSRTNGSAAGLKQLQTSSPRSRMRHILSPLKTPQHKKVPIAKDTPIACKLDGLHGSFHPNKSEDVDKSHEAEGRKVIIGPMPAKLFIDEFLPEVNKPMPDATGAFHKVPSTVTDEKVEAINNHGRCPSICFCITAETPENEKSGRGSLKPDVCGYTPKDVRRVRLRKKKKGSKQKCGRFEANLGLAELVVEIKRHHDPICEHFHDDENEMSCPSFFSSDNHLDGKNTNEKNDTNVAREEKRNLGQSIAYASENFARQHRMFSFSVMVIGTRVRFFRWDRAGAIVTEAFDYRDEPELLCEFLWRFHLANPIQRGFDPTVTVATKAEENLFKKLIMGHVTLQLGIASTRSEKVKKGLMKHYEKGKVTKMEVYELGKTSPDSYLVSVPQMSPLSAAGQSTRAYWAVKLTGKGKGVVHFLKDTWRVAVTGAAVEGQVYETLMKESIDNICDLVCYGDVPEFELEKPGCDAYGVQFSDDSSPGLNDNPRPDPEYSMPQCTKTDQFIDAEWVCKCLKTYLSKRVFKHTHCRIVLEQAGYPLETFTGSRELFGAAKDVLDALDSTYERCQIIHRDVSLHNVILYRSKLSDCRRGLLVDWSSSILRDGQAPPTSYFRTASWAFVSGRVLNANGSVQQTKEDDLESLFYVVMYGSIRWLPHDSVKDLGSWMFNFFDETEIAKGNNGEDQGGAPKLLHQSISGAKFREKFKFSNENIVLWFEATYKCLGSIYEKPQDSGSWDAKHLKDITNVVYTELLKEKSTIDDRVEHGVSDYYVEAKAQGVQRGTHTSRSNNRDRHSLPLPGNQGSSIIPLKRQNSGPPPQSRPTKWALVSENPSESKATPSVDGSGRLVGPYHLRSRRKWG